MIINMHLIHQQARESGHILHSVVLSPLMLHDKQVYMLTNVRSSLAIEKHGWLMKLKHNMITKTQSLNLEHLVLCANLEGSPHSCQEMSVHRCYRHFLVHLKPVGVVVFGSLC